MYRVILSLVLLAFPSVLLAENFDAFFKRFASDIQYSNSRTEYPLRSVNFEYEADENDPDVPPNKVSFIQKGFIGDQTSLNDFIKRYRLETAVIDRKTAFDRTVKIYKSGADFLMKYRFRLVNEQWMLIEIIDYSL